MTTGSHGWRRELSREVSRCLAAKPLEILGSPLLSPSPRVHRTGFTGPPGAGKSTLIGIWSALRMARGRKVGVIAVDPSSPVSGGSLLGDRIRMGQVSQRNEFFLRSVPSCGSHDGLCRNACGVLDVVEAAGFQDVVLETVGIGQGECAVRDLVDTLVVVLVPESGDTIQAMKAGLLELADIYVINKSDLPGAERVRQELESVLHLRPARDDGWSPDVISLSATGAATGLAALDEAIDGHKAFLDRAGRMEERRQRRVRQRLAEVFVAELARVLGETGTVAENNGLLETYRSLLAKMEHPQ